MARNPPNRPTDEEQPAAPPSQQEMESGSEMAKKLAGMRAAQMGHDVAERYAKIGANLLSDPSPTRLDQRLIQRLARHGFDPDRLSRIRVHTGLKAQSATGALGARAFAVGDQDIFFNRGEFNPASREGRAVLAHEVAHVAPPAAPGTFSASGGMSGAMGGEASSFGRVLSMRRKDETNEEERQKAEKMARRAEQQVYALEDDHSSLPPMVSKATLGPENPSMDESYAERSADHEKPGDVEVDERQLEDRVWRLLDTMMRRERERTGSPSW